MDEGEPTIRGHKWVKYSSLLRTAGLHQSARPEMSRTILRRSGPRYEVAWRGKPHAWLPAWGKQAKRQGRTIWYDMRVVNKLMGDASAV